MIVSLLKGVVLFGLTVSKAFQTESLAQNTYIWKMSSVSKRTKLFLLYSFKNLYYGIYISDISIFCH